MRNVILAMLFGASVLTNVSPVVADESDRVLSIAVFGDTPYGNNDADTAQFLATPAFIKSINDDRNVSLVLNVGDIHSGKQTCSLGYDQSIYELWRSFKFPVVYTPGDNEWTDCHKSKEGGGDPLVNLSYVRDTFFASPGHTLAVDKPVLSQSQNFDPNFPKDVDYVENVMWEQSRVVFVTLNLPGGSNNDEDNWFGLARTQPQTDEILNRTGANLRWLDRAFALAQADHAKAVVIQLQADMWDLDGNSPSHIGAYRQFIDSIALQTTNFGRPVLLLNGDSHGYRSDNPLLKGAPCVTERIGSQSTEVACPNDAYDNQPNDYHLKNFHRIIVHGSNSVDNPNMEWLKLTVRSDDDDDRRAGANSFGPFSWKRMIQALPAKP